MTTTKEAAGLVERLDYAAKPLPFGTPGVLPTRKLYGEAAQEIRTLLAQVEELRRERDLLSKMLAPDAVTRVTETLLTVQNGALDLARKLVIETARANDAEARATKAEAGIAEAVKALEPFAVEADEISEDWSDGVEVGNNITVRHHRAARAFVEKHKESGNG